MVPLVLSSQEAKVDRTQVTNSIFHSLEFGFVLGGYFIVLANSYGILLPHILWYIMCPESK